MKHTRLFTLAILLKLTTSFANDKQISPKHILQNSNKAQLEDLFWIKRPIVVFADNPNDAHFIKQMAFLRLSLDQLLARDIAIFTDTTPSLNSMLRKKLQPQGFMWVLMGKDGGIKLSQQVPWDVQQISQVIDSTPMRQEEMLTHD